MKAKHFFHAALVAAGSALALACQGCQSLGMSASIPGPGTFAAAQRAAPGAPIAIVNARIIDGTGRTPLDGGILLVDGERIVAVGDRASVMLPEGCLQVDAAGASVLPGFVNAHVHNAYCETHAALFAASGVTTVRDLSCGASEVEAATTFRDRARSNPRLCRVVSSGSMIVVPWGYMSRYGIAVRNETDAKAAVQREVAAGVDFVKITLQEPTFPQLANLSPLMAAALVSEAHRHGVPVTAHVGTSRDLAVALDAGVDDVAHIVSDSLSNSLIRRMVDADVPLEPTLTNWGPSTGAERDRILSNLRRFLNAGGRIALGAEHIHSRKNGGAFIGMPIAELLMMQEAGMTPAQIIQASTKESARVCRLDRILGTLEPGKLADILIVDGDPLSDLNALSNVKLVMHSGVIIRG